ncbi:MAG: HTTM domain-containing protein [Planctomycetales bacterium]|nr:HTTM domain-containing protein [Planctomycetales bacterium]
MKTKTRTQPRPTIVQEATEQPATVFSAVVQWCRDVLACWCRFWFTPTAPQTLAAIRIMGGAMLVYTHVVYAIDLNAFVGADSWISSDLSREIHSGGTASSFLWYVQSPPVMWIVHAVSLVVLFCLMIGFMSRIAAALALCITVSYSHRLIGAQFGLDQVNAMLAMYLIVGPCGAAYSVDNWLAKRKSGTNRAHQPTVSANVAIRLIQCHMCIMYLFAGIAKMRGGTWWDGSAVWFAIASFEYQSLDATWLGRWPHVIALLSHVTVFWETFYCVLVWPRLSRPIILVLAVAVHGGIAMYLGMITFGLAMLIGNFAFIEPKLVDATVRRMSSLTSRMTAS